MEESPGSIGGRVILKVVPGLKYCLFTAGFRMWMAPEKYPQEVRISRHKGTPKGFTS